MGSAGVLAAVCLLAYGPFLGGLGFYRDDWYMLWAGDAFGPEAIVKLFAIDRPFMGYVYSLAYRVLGDIPLNWQLLAFALRLAGALAFLWLLRQMWPSHRRETTLAAILMAVYPGFLQQPNGNTFLNPIGYGLALLSIALLYRVVVGSGWWRGPAFLLSLATAVGYWNTYEYMIGLEVLRAAVVVVAGTRSGAVGIRGIVKSAVQWLWPFWLAGAGYVYWRLFVFESLRPAMNVERLLNVYQADVARTILRTAMEFGKDLVETTFFGWIVPNHQLVSSAGYRDLALAVLIGAAGVSLVLAYGWWSRGEDGHGAEQPLVASWTSAWIILGAVTIAGALAPVAMAQRDVHWHSGFDRYSLPATAGIGIFLVGLLWGHARARFRLVVVGFLVFLALVTHTLNGLHWKAFWEVQRNVWWQLAWRAPQLDEGTVLVVQIPVDGYYEDYEAWGPANLIFNPGVPRIRIGAEVMIEETYDDVRFGVRETRGVRGLVDYDRDFGFLLVLAMPTEASCLHVMGGDRQEFPLDTDPLVRLLAPYSRIELILPDGSGHVPPSRIFGSEPEPSWCFLYQKASLARQRGDWEEAVRLGERAFAQGFKPSDRSEWMPFLEAYVTLGHTERAGQIADLIRDKDPIRHSLCDELANEPVADPARHDELVRLLCE